MFARSAYKHASSSSCVTRRTLTTLTTLPNNPHIYVFPDRRALISSFLLTLLPSSPPNPHLSIGTSPTLPPSPSTFVPNPHFLSLLHQTLARYASSDPTVIASASAYASSSGSNLGSGGRFFPSSPPSASEKRERSAERRKAREAVHKEYGEGKAEKEGGSAYVGGDGGGAGGSGAGGANVQGGHGGAGRGGWVHIYDERRPPDFGRIPEPEDIFGSVEVDGKGEFVAGEGDGEGITGGGKEGKSGYAGRYQSSGTYRVVTKEGILGLSGYMRGKLVERLKEEEEKG